MNYNEYDRIQMELTGVGDGLRSEIRHILMNSNADQETQELVSQVCNKISRSFDEIALLLSQAMRASIE